MEGPAIIRLDNQVNAAATRLSRQTGAAIVVVACLSNDHGTQVLWRAEDMSLHQHELAIYDMLRGLEKETQDSALAGCPDCVARYERVQAALAALAPCAGPAGQPPAGSC